MNPYFERLGPPFLVLGVALYLGWPPAMPPDLEKETVRANTVRANTVQANTVRWSASDLQPPLAVNTPARDPFAEVLVNHDEPVQPLVEAETVQDPVPNRLSEAEMRDEISVSGTAEMDMRRWAIVNGRVVSQGDVLTVDGDRSFSAQVLSIDDGQVVVAAEGITFAIQRSEAGRRH